MPGERDVPAVTARGFSYLAVDRFGAEHVTYTGSHSSPAYTHAVLRYRTSKSKAGWKSPDMMGVSFENGLAEAEAVAGRIRTRAGGRPCLVEIVTVTAFRGRLSPIRERSGG